MEKRAARRPAGASRAPTRGTYLRRRLTALVLVGVVLGGACLLLFRAVRSGALPHVEVAGTDVSGLTETGLTAAMIALAEKREADTVKVVRPPAGGLPRRARSYTRAELGYSMDAAATVERVLERGRQPNPLAALADQIVASFSTIEVDPVESVSPSALEAWAEEVARKMAVPPVEGALRFDGTTIEKVMPRPGAVIDEERLAAVARSVATDDTLSPLQVPVDPGVPETTDEMVDAAAADGRQILRAPITLTAHGRRAVLNPSVIAEALASDVVGDGDDMKIEVLVRPKALEAAVGRQLRSLEKRPQDADLSLVSGRVVVIPGTAGFAVDYGRLAERLLTIAGSKDRTAAVPGKKEPPAFSTADARKLDISEQVASFTTDHVCCEPRVTNIHRIADIVDGTVVEPGETFSVNDTVGPRTRTKGFVAAPAIYEGEYVEEIGGGVSQFATTLFNAVFFGGYDFVEYKAHSYYISRYPMGREATLSYPAVDLAFTNDSDAGIYIDTSYTDTSITVTLYGDSHLDVTSRSGDPHNFQKPPVQCKENRSLRRDQTVVLQDGSRGFDIVVERIFQNTERPNERFFTRYLPEPRIVQKRSCD